MTYHLQHWEYFIELSCFVPHHIEEVLSDSLISLEIGTSSIAFSSIASSVNCARTREGLETIIFLLLQAYIGDTIKNNPLIFDKILETIDKKIGELKIYWAEDHIRVKND